MHGLSGMNIKIKLLPLLIAITALTTAGCDTASESPYSPGGGSSGLPVSHKNFNLFVDPVDPAVIDDDGSHGGVEVTLTVEAGDKFNASVSGGTVHFVPEWGILDKNTCEIIDGSCSVTWTSDSNFNYLPADLSTAIVAYTYGEESYVDLNGSGTFDDADGNSFLIDIMEPFLDLDRSYTYTAADQVIDTDNNGIHTPVDGMFNGSGCAHSTLCGSPSRIIIWDGIYLNMDQRTVGTAPTASITAPADSSTISGTETFSVTANDAEDGTITGTNTPVAGVDIQWNSSVEGDFGSNSNSFALDISGWTAGAHVITVTVTDSDGNTVTDTVSVTK